MTSVDDFVRTQILTFPSLFPHRTAVLHHALCVIGNGYKWSDEGELVADFFRPVPLWNKEAELAELDSYLKSQFDDERIIELIGSEFRKDIDSCEIVIEEIEIRVNERPAIKDIYPQHNDYALLMNQPSNLTEDWKEACAEMKVLAQEAGWSF